MSSDEVTVAEEVTACRLFLYGLSYITLLCPERHGQLPALAGMCQQVKPQ